MEPIRLNHPLVEHKLSILRDKKTGTKATIPRPQTKPAQNYEKNKIFKKKKKKNKQTHGRFFKM